MLLQYFPPYRNISKYDTSIKEKIELIVKHCLN